MDFGLRFLYSHKNVKGKVSEQVGLKKRGGLSSEIFLHSVVPRPSRNILPRGKHGKLEVTPGKDRVMLFSLSTP